MWTLGAPAMLGWLAAAIIPLVLLWWYRARRIEMKFAAMQFLERAIAREGRRRSWLQWLVVALQMLALVLLTLAWGNFQGLLDRTSANKPDWQVLIVDATASMLATSKGEQQTHFDKAIAAARDVVRRSPRGDAFLLLVIGQECDVVLGEPTTDAQQVLQELDRLQVSYEAGNGLAALEELPRLLVHPDSPLHPGWIVLHLFSDFQASTWSDEEAGTWTENLGQSDYSIRYQVRLHDTGTLPTDAHAIKNLASSEPWLFSSQPTAVSATIENPSHEERTVRVVWRDGEKVIGDDSVKLGKQPATNVERRLTFSEPGEHFITAQLDDGDVLSFSDRGRLVVSVRDQVKILAIGSTAEDTRPATVALTAANAVQVEERSDRQALTGDLQHYDLLLLANLPGLTDAESRIVGEFLRKGGGVIIVLGDRSRAEDWSRIPWLPANVAPPEEPRLATFVPQLEHPLLRVFGQSDGGLSTTPTWQHFVLEPRAGSEVPLYFTPSEEGPAAVIKTEGAGRVILWGIPWSGNAEVKLADGSAAPWTALDQWPTFVPLANESMKYVTARDESLRSVIVRTPLVGHSARVGATSWEIIRPDGRADRVAVQKTEEGERWSYANTNLPGFYELRAGASSSEQFAVNVADAETDRSLTDTSKLTWIEDSRLSDVVRFSRDVPWFRVFFVAAMVVLLGETFLTWQLGRKSA